MTHHTLRNTVFAFAALLFSAVAQADVVKCVDQSGHVTLTDMPCPDDAWTAQSSAPVAPPPVMGKASALHVIASGSENRRDSWVRKSGPDRSQTLDVATLKAARISMQVMDQAASLMRQQKLAGTN